MAASTHQGADNRHNKTAQEKRASMVFTGVLTLTLLLFGVWIMNYVPLRTNAVLIDTEGQPKNITNLFMASTLCQRQAVLNYKGDLIQAITDDFSTRYDRPRDIFIVLLMVSVYEKAKRPLEYRVHCHVIPEDTEVSYFKGFSTGV